MAVPRRQAWPGVSLPRLRFKFVLVLVRVLVLELAQNRYTSLTAEVLSNRLTIRNPSGAFIIFHDYDYAYDYAYEYEYEYDFSSCVEIIN